MHQRTAFFVVTCPICPLAKMLQEPMDAVLTSPFAKQENATAKALVHSSHYLEAHSLNCFFVPVILCCPEPRLATLNAKYDLLICSST